MLSQAKTLFCIPGMGTLCAISLVSLAFPLYASEEIQFNDDMLDINDRHNIDLSQFSRSGYIMPGNYSLVVHVNKYDIQEQKVSFVTPINDPKGSEACLSPVIVEQIGFREEIKKSLTWTHNGQCLDLKNLDGVEARGDLSTSSLYLNIPQAYLEYISENWEPPSRWDEGMPGILLDYNTNFQTQKLHASGESNYSITGNGISGVNLGTWRLRADWQANLSHTTGSNIPTDKQFDWTRYYAYRPIPFIRAKLIAGEDYLSSDIFDSFRFSGMSLRSDTSMLPPNLRGYAPEIRGVAKSNAKVVISQQGRILYETQVAAGPFRIQEINDAVSGELDIEIQEQDGSVQKSKISTASIPYLTRPGTVRYKLALGKPSEWGHQLRGPVFGAGEYSWGISNGWSLYSGAILGGDYSAYSLGIGRDLMELGALSFDATRSRAKFVEDYVLMGDSYRLSYSKNFDKYDSNVTFAGYRFSQEDFMSMREYLDMRFENGRNGQSKEMYTLTVNKHFRDFGVSSYLNYSHQTYWDIAANDRYNLTVSRYFGLGNIKNASLSFSAYRNHYDERNDDGVYLSMSLPWGNTGSLSYNAGVNREQNTHSLAYHDRIDEHNNYHISTGLSDSKATASGFYSHKSAIAEINANVSYQEGRYSAVGLGAQGGITLIPNGLALHRINTPGGTRLMLDTNGVADVPVRGYGSSVLTNGYGKAVVTDVNSYYRNSASIDLNNLGDKVEAISSVVQATLTEGAIGYRSFDVISGYKAMATIKLTDGSTPPFGATIVNQRNQETGIVNDVGSAYISGINPGEVMTVQWNATAQCEIQLPIKVEDDQFLNNLLLKCYPLGSRKMALDSSSKVN